MGHHRLFPNTDYNIWFLEFGAAAKSNAKGKQPYRPEPRALSRGSSAAPHVFLVNLVTLTVIYHSVFVK